MTRSLTSIGAVALSVLFVAGCGGSDNGGSSGNGTVRTETVHQDTRVEVVKPARGEGFDPVTIYKRDAPGVVTVFSVLPTTTGGLLGAKGPQEEGVGSGFVIKGSGEIVTNAHVVTNGEGASIRKAKEVYVAFGDGNEVSAKVVGFDPNADVALLRVNPAGLTLRPLSVVSTRSVQVGEPVAAIGSPFGEPQSLSVGVISAKDRSIDSLTGFSISGALQTDAAINHGNSGGPLVNARGEVLGINSQIQSSSGGGEGVGYAVPGDIVRRVLPQLRRQGHVAYAYLGVSTTRIYPQLARRFHLPVTQGAWIQEVVKSGPAAKAGLKAGHKTERFQAQRLTVGGDIVVAVDGHPVRKDTDLGQTLLSYKPAQHARIEIYRGATKRTVDVTLGQRPQEAAPATAP